MHIERMAFEEDLRKKFEALLASPAQLKEGFLTFLCMMKKKNAFKGLECADRQMLLRYGRST